MTARYSLPILCLLAASFAAAAEPDKAEFFEKKIRPLLAANCYRCHGGEKQKGGLRLDSIDAALKGGSTGPALVPGDPERSLLLKAVRHEDEKIQMPPTGNKLEGEQIAALATWIRMGAPWPQAHGAPVAAIDVASAKKHHWAFQPVQSPPLPAVQRAFWPQSPLDYFVLAKLEENGLRPVPPADKRTLLRRVTFDLIGLPPTPEEMDAFVKDESPEAFAQVVDRLLASPHYGERWGRHWLDLARYGEDQAHTFQSRKYPHGYRYRDWIVQALNSDMPYDRFIVEQIAGDLIEGPNREDRLAALGMFSLGPVYYGKATADELDDRVDTLSRGFLGLTVACARCHDHKYDPIPTRDYYSLAGIFASTQYKEYPLATGGDYAQADADIKATEKQLNQYTTQELARVVLASGGLLPVPNNQLERALPSETRKKVTAMRGELDKMKKEMARFPLVHSLTEGNQIANMRVYIRGNPATPGDEAPRQFLSVLCDAQRPFTKGSGRLELAKAIASKENPLTARVMVNRIWYHHFGRGIVGTPSNFGSLGERPTHPELLDYLAGQFMAEGWSLKRLHRTILLSATYQLSGRLDAKNNVHDAENKLLWRMNRRRLEVESWRDAMLAVSGNLDRRLGGASLDLSSPDNRRRSFYAAISRHNLDPLLRLFDFPDPNVPADRRPITTVPLQQLFVLNSEFMVRQSRALSARLTENEKEDTLGRIRRAFEIVYGRPASEREMHLAMEFLGEAVDSPLTPWEQYAQVLLGANEFAYID